MSSAIILVVRICVGGRAVGGDADGGGVGSPAAIAGRVGRNARTGGRLVAPGPSSSESSHAACFSKRNDGPILFSQRHLVLHAFDGRFKGGHYYARPAAVMAPVSHRRAPERHAKPARALLDEANLVADQPLLH